MHVASTQTACGLCAWCGYYASMRRRHWPKQRSVSNSRPLHVRGAVHERPVQPTACTWAVCSVFGLSYAPRTAVRVRGLYSDRTCGAPHVALRSAIHSSAFVTVVPGPLWSAAICLRGAGPVVLKQK